MSGVVASTAFVVGRFSIPLERLPQCSPSRLRVQLLAELELEQERAAVLAELLAESVKAWGRASVRDLDLA